MAQERRFIKIGEYNGWSLEVEELTGEDRAKMTRYLLQALKEQRERLLRAYLEGRLDLHQFGIKKREVDREIHELEQAPEKVPKVVKGVVGHPGALVWIITNGDYEELYNFEKPELAVLSLIREISVIRHDKKSGTVRIRWWIPVAE